MENLNQSINMQDSRNLPLSVSDWFITLLITFIPIVNVIMYLVWAFSDSTNHSKRNFAKAALIWIAIGIVLYTILFLTIGVALFSSMMNN
jgi:heme/copper-type cytochrome/quinol oxidase subunit 2